MSNVSRRNFLRLAGSVAFFGMVSESAAELSSSANAFTEKGGRALDYPNGFPPDPVRGAVSSTWADGWEDGMVTGNGRMGALVFGGENPVIVVCHNKLYTSQLDPSQRHPAETAQFVPEIRRLIRDESYDAALDFSYQMSKQNGLSPDESIDFHPGFFLKIKIEGQTAITDFRRSENFETAETTTAWATSEGIYCLKVFASRADDVVVVSLRGPSDGNLNCTLEIPGPDSDLVSAHQSTGESWLGTQVLYAPGNGGYDAVMRVTANRGKVTISPGMAVVAGADEITAMIRIDRFRPPAVGGIDILAGELLEIESHYQRLLVAHVSIHGAIFNRARLDLGGSSESRMATDTLLARAAADRQLSPALIEKIYDACRYVVLCSSGDLPPNLQGIWTGTWKPPWHGDYSADANLQLAVESTLSANMPELMEGFFKLIESGLPSWREGATKLAGCRGILYPARMQDQGVYFQQNHDWQWFNQVSIAGWLGHYFYDYYRYTGDKEFLANRAVPYLKECALFYEDWYTEDVNGALRSSPSFSYECAFSDNATIDFAVARETLTNLIAACEMLKVEEEGVLRWRKLLAKIPDYMINSRENTGGPPPHLRIMDGGEQAVADGTLKEFIEPNMLEFPHHRHLSSLYPLFVSNELDPVATLELWDAAEKQYEKKINGVQETESHFRMQASLCAARLGRGDDAWGFLTTMAANGVFHSSLIPSHYDHLNVFNVDASGGIPAVINNCLVYSLPGRLDLLPALPSSLRSGAIYGILARGQIEIKELSWDLDKGTACLKIDSGNRQSVAFSVPPVVSNARIKFRGQWLNAALLSNGKYGAVIRIPKGETVLNFSFEMAPIT